MNARGKKILIVGLGVSGFSAAVLLSEKGAIVSVSESLQSEVVKKRRDLLVGKGVLVEIGAHTREFCEGCELVVVSPGVDKNDLPFQGYSEGKVPVIGELELGYLFCSAPIVAITGTNGKTTVTSLTGDILAASGKHTVVCGNIGKAFTGEVEKITEKSSVVLEVSSFQLETIRDFRPRVAVLLNVTDDHYDRHDCFEGYKDIKFGIFSNQTSSDWAVIHSDFAEDPALKKIRSKIVFYGGKLARYRAEDDRVILSLPGKEEIFLIDDEVSIKGKHNMENIACCCQIAEIEGVDVSTVKKAIINFKGLEHRFQKVAAFGGLVFIDDSKATNVDATKRALESVDTRVVLIAGGRDKLGNYGVLSVLMAERVSTLVVIGEARENIKKVFSGIVNILEADSMADAVEKAVEVAQKGEAVMLSPMCSSFDMFESYRHRGRVFCEAVKVVSERSGLS